ncbi:hypothetical protein J4231_01515 [Candidatus Woesearchaeota archaeon]|nr:hypothetical protein [Candidatus Woesearchaeota archaeon]
MASKLNPKVVSLSFASVAAIWYVACAAFVLIFPDSAISVFGNIFHGIDISQIATSSITAGGLVIGLIEVTIGSLLTGWIFAEIYNYFSGKL